MNLVSVQDTEISESEWQFSVSSELVGEHETMSGAVHGLDTKSVNFTIIRWDGKQVVLVVDIVT